MSATTPTREVQALLFDLGGVVIEIDFDRALAHWSACCRLPIDAIRRRFSFDAAYQSHERGEIEAAEYFSSLRRSLGVSLTDAEFLEGWTAIYVGEVAGIRPLLASLEAAIPLYAFTNSNAAHQRFWARTYADTLKPFRRVFVSSELGKRKPEPEAFASIADAVGVPLSRILFFDDTRENVDAARAIGMPAVHVTSIRDVEGAVGGLRAST